jgi:hypothetical protein
VLSRCSQIQGPTPKRAAKSAPPQDSRRYFHTEEADTHSSKPRFYVVSKTRRSFFLARVPLPVPAMATRRTRIKSSCNHRSGMRARPGELEPDKAYGRGDRPVRSDE